MLRGLLALALFASPLTGAAEPAASAIVEPATAPDGQSDEQPAEEPETPPDPCAPIERIDGPPVYVIMHGYPYNPQPHVDPLTMVDRDLINMSHFFRSLGPRRAFVHGVNTDAMDAAFGRARRPASWRALLASVDTVIEDIDGLDAMREGTRRPQVYLYFVGHGAVDTRDRLQITTAPERKPEGPGYDGNLDSKLIADRIVAPLAARADVHVIADICHGYHMVQTRSGYSRNKLDPRPPRSMIYDYDFSRRFPGAGAVLASRGETPEIEPYGGVFSHLVRSLAIGVADFDRDGVITYGEMADALPQVIPEMEEGPQPEVVAPDLDRERPFIDWRATSAAKVCLADDFEGRYTLVDAPEMYATVYVPGERRGYWLPRDRTFGLARSGFEPRYFVAADGPAAFLAQNPYAEPPAPPMLADPSAPPPETAEAIAAAETFEPLASMMSSEPTLSASTEVPFELLVRWSPGLGATVGYTLVNVPDGDDFDHWWHIDLAGRMGYGRSQFLFEGGYARASAFATSSDPRGPPAPLKGYRLGGRVGYGFLLVNGPVDASVSALYGLHLLHSDNGPPITGRAFAEEYALRGTVIWPWDAWSRLGARVDAEVGVTYAGRRVGPVFKLSAGLDVEGILD